MNSPVAAGRLALSLFALAALASCGGGGGGDAPSATAAASDGSGMKKAQAYVPPGAIPSDANVKGMWSPVYPWPLIAVHAVLMPDGRVMTYGTDATGKQTGYFIYDVWDISRRARARPPDAAQRHRHRHLLRLAARAAAGRQRCSSPAATTGPARGTTNTGNNNSNVFDYSANTLTRGNNMNRARWYSSSTTLLNGEVYIQGGSGGTDRPEIRGADGTFRLLSGADTSALDFMYPRNFVAPDGRVFGYDSSGQDVLRQPDRQRQRHAGRASSAPPTAAPATPARRCSARAASCSSAATPTARS